MIRSLLFTFLAFLGSASAQRYGSSGSGLSSSCNCNSEYIPFCATDGRRETTYSNKCQLQCAQRQNPSLRIKFEGVCAEPYIPTDGRSGGGNNKIIGGFPSSNGRQSDRYGSASQTRPVWTSGSSFNRYPSSGSSSSTRFPSGSSSSGRYPTVNHPGISTTWGTSSNRYGSSSSGSRTTQRPLVTYPLPSSGSRYPSYQGSPTTIRPWYESAQTRYPTESRRSRGADDDDDDDDEDDNADASEDQNEEETEGDYTVTDDSESD